MINAQDIKNGTCIRMDGKLYFCIEFLHVKPGKGPAFVRTKLRNVKTGRILENTFTSGVKIDTARIERRPYQFLYKEGEDYVMMHTETFEQVNIPEELINAPQFLKEGDAVEILPTLDKKYDVVFIDAAKGKYPFFLEQAKRMLNKNGIIFADNILYKGYVMSDYNKHKQRTAVRNLREYIKEVTEDENCTTEILEVGDGLAISRF